VRFDKARALLREFKGDAYVYGTGALDQVGRVASDLGRKAALIYPGFPTSEALVDRVISSLAESGMVLASRIRGAAPNAPREDVRRIARELEDSSPDVIVCLGGGSLIDATKAAEVLRSLGGTIDDYFGTGRVTELKRAAGKALTPVVAVQTAASSAAHLTKYSNITDLSKGQKKLIVDDVIVPERAIFDYEVTVSMPPDLTADGAWDGIAHCLEVLYGAAGQPHYAKVAEVAREAVGLVIDYVERAVYTPADVEARAALGYATDLGGYAIMLGGTSGPHLTSFSFVDILTHGRACGILHPYYAVFFAPQGQAALRMVGGLFREAGLTEVDIGALSGRRLGVAVARAMMELSERIGFPTTLGEVGGFSTAHIERALAAAKDPQLRMKLENMPVPLSAQMVDEYMGSVLLAAYKGDLSLVKNVRWPPVDVH
jgi:alcohol dehydrogenase